MGKTTNPTRWCVKCPWKQVPLVRNESLEEGSVVPSIVRNESDYLTEKKNQRRSAGLPAVASALAYLIDEVEL
jgi:hypothetical protein